MSKKHNLSVKKGRDLLRVILLLLWFVKKPKSGSDTVGKE
jgi:hypothetical protein